MEVESLSVKSVSVLILAIVLASCRGDAKMVLHPTTENVQSVTDPRFALHEDASGSVPWVDLSTLEGVLIGVEESAPLEMVGLVWDVDISMNALYYVDFVYGHVRVYNSRGDLTSVVGKPGKGPGEFANVNKVAVMEADEGPLLVIGTSSRNVSVFQQEGRTWALRHSFITAHAFMRGDLCAMHGHVYTIGYSEEYPGVIHKHTLQGEHVLSFGEPYNDPDPFIHRSLSERGALDCNETHRTVAYADGLNPVVTGFSDSGVARWRVQLADADIAPTPQFREDDGRPSIGFPSPGNGETSSIKFISGTLPDVFLVSYDTYGPKGAETQHVFSVGAVSGYGAYVGWLSLLRDGREQPHVTALDRQRLYTVAGSPYPHLGIYPRPAASL